MPTLPAVLASRRTATVLIAGSTGTSLDTTNAVATADSRASDGTTITMTRRVTESGDDQVTYFVTDLVLTDATNLRTGFANDEFGENVVADTSSIAGGNDAVFAVNGDYCEFREAGIEIRNGTLLYFQGEVVNGAIATHRAGGRQAEFRPRMTQDHWSAKWGSLGHVERGEVSDDS
jgi:exopolysaccharide biosynthesis protein